jgi:hypothetical protein
MQTTNPADWTDADTPESLLEAVGYEWCRTWNPETRCYEVEVYQSVDRKHLRACDESPDCDTARALVIAANSLKESEEQS